MKIRLIQGSWWEFLRSNYDEKTDIVTVYNTGRNSHQLFDVLSHELGHHNFEMQYRAFPLWRKVIAKIFMEHEMRACIQEGKEVEIE